jgi:beta-lactamase class C
MIYKNLFYVILFICIAIQLCFSQKSNFTKLDSILVEYNSYVEDFIKEREVPGVAIAIVVNNKIEFIKGFGVNKIGEKDSIGIHSIFRIASVSKGFASVLAGVLVKDKILNWDDTIIKHLPDFVLKDSATTQYLTIRHILSHTSGLTPHAYDNLIEADFPFTKIMERLKEVNVHCPVGECYGYQNTVYSLIDPIIKSATGKSYIKMLKAKITDPIGMKNVSFNQEDMIASQHQTFPHVRRRGKWVAREIRESYYNVPASAGINASIYDMAYWLRALMGGKPEIIPPSVINEVSKPIISTPREKYRYNTEKRIKHAAYGLGWRIFDYAGYTMIFHSGGMRGYLVKLAFFPKYKMGIVVLQNARFGNNFLYKFIDLYFGIEQDSIIKKNK